MESGGAQCPVFSVFSSSTGWKRIWDVPISQNPCLIDSRVRLAGLFEVTRARSIQVLKVRTFSPSLEAGDHSLKVSSTLDTDQEEHNLGLGGLLLKAPFNNRQTRGCWPTQNPSIGFRVAERAERCRLIVRYWAPLSYKEAR